MTIRTMRGLGLGGRAPLAPRAGAALAVALAAVGGAAAQDFEDRVGVGVGDARLYPSLRVDYLTDSNIDLSADDEEEGNTTVVSPRLDFVAERRQLALDVVYLGAFSASDESELEYADHELSAGLDAEFDSRRRASAALTLARDHDDLGTELTRGRADEFDEPVEYDTVALATGFTYGAAGARGNLGVGLDLASRSYVNLSAVTDGRDYTRVEPYAAFGYRLSSDTRAVVELRFASVAFDDERFDRDEIALLGGADFTATGRLRGGFRLGASRADFDREGVDDEPALIATANIDYLPREFAVLSLSLLREFDNTTSTQVGEDQSIRTTAELGWDHQWSSRFSTDAFARLTDVARTCPERATSTGSVGIELDLEVRNWLAFGASAVQSSRSGDGCEDRGGGSADDLDYDRTRYGLYARVEL